MKEQMLPFTNIDTSEVARRTPRMVEGLTTYSFPPKLEGERNIFMAEPGRGEILGNKPLGGNPAPETNSSIPLKPSRKPTEEMARKAWGFINEGRVVDRGELETQEMFIKMRILPAGGGIGEEGGLLGGQLGGEPRSGGEPRTPSNFQEVVVSSLDEELQREQGRRGRPLEEIEVATVRERVESLSRLSSYVEANRRAVQAGLLDVQGAYNNLNEAVKRDEIRVDHAQQHLDELAQRYAERIIRQGVDPRVGQIREAREAKNPEEERILLNKMIEEFDPDSTRSISTEDFRVIAEDQEGAEKLLDKIISRPLAVPIDHYELSFYANINLYTFFSEVRRIDPERFRKYAELKTATLIFHEMNRGITVESGNISAFLGLTRSVTPEHLQTATELDGVELVRQLTEEALGRLYTEKSETTGNKIDPAINEWVSRQFRDMAARGIVKSSNFKDADGNSRNLESWEIDRALAFGRNMHSSFYRKSELYSWSSVPLERQNWLNAPPTETVLRVLAGLKWLTYRFRYGEVGGGPALTALLYDSITEEYREKEPKLEKIGKLNILKDILPTGFFNSAGFDSGWRAFRAYLGSDVMVVRINPNDFSKSSDSVKLAIREFLQEEGFSEEGGEVNFSRFLIRQEYKAREKFVREEKVGRVSGFPETLPPNIPGINKQMREVIEPIMEQVNLSLGILIKYSGDEKLRALLWEKTADLLPLRIAYLLSEQGVKGVEGYEDKDNKGAYIIKGEGSSLFSDEFESKLLKAQHLRIEKQKGNAKAGVRTGVSLDSFLDEAGMTGEEKQFVVALKELGKKKASELAKIPFPHIPFLEDAPFREAKYTELPSEVFYRKMGSDFEGFFNAGNGLNNIVGDLSQPYSEILKNLKGVYAGITSAESARDGQNIVFPILQSYLKLAEQYVWTRWIPFAKTTRGFLNEPTSLLQEFFGKDALSTDESTMRDMINQAVGIGVTRREKLPGEDKSQFDDLAERAGATAFDVALDQGRTLSVIIAFIMAGAFVAQTSKQLAEEIKKG